MTRKSKQPSTELEALYVGVDQSGNGNRGKHFDRFEFKSLRLESLSDFAISNLMELSSLTVPPALLGG